MDHAGLDHGVGPGRLDRLGQARQPVAAHDQHVSDAAVGEFGAHASPEGGALVGLHPDPQDVLDALHVDSDGDVGRLVGHPPAVADLDTDRVEVDHRVELLQRATLPLQDGVGDGVGDVADRPRDQLCPQGGVQVVADLAHRHPAGVQADDHAVQPVHAPLALAHQAGRERAGAVAGDLDLERAHLGVHRLG